MTERTLLWQASAGAEVSDGRELDVETLISEPMRRAVDELEGAAPMLAGMCRYHLGWVEHTFEPVRAGSVDQGKRMRPLVALLCCQAAGGQARTAAPLAAAVELLHNFTLVHDDIQDQSPTRRHRPTVWDHWGAAQAINAGDALFAAAHLALYRAGDEGVPADLVLRLGAAFDQMTIAIVSGQVLDLSFESRRDVAPEEYLQMIAGKTAAIVRYAAWGGALLGGASMEEAEGWGVFGLALGLGFQVQDDLLGVWGSSNQTGKAEADDIRRRKQSLPVITLRSLVTDSELVELDALYTPDEIGEAGVRRVLDLLDRYGVREIVERRVRDHHDEASRALALACPDPENRARRVLEDVVAKLAARSH